MTFFPEYQPDEAKALLALCAYAESGATQPPIPDPGAAWVCLYDSPVMGPLSNKWQLWQRKNAGPYAIVLRGTVDAAGSIFEDLVSLMVKAAGTVAIGNACRPYKFAADAEAGVHLGFALGTLLLLDDPAGGILAQAKLRIRPGSDVYLTGHSQGAAMATLLASHLHYNGGLPAGCAVKIYVYAQPKPGNPHYAQDFEGLFGAPAMGFRVTNTLDWVPQVPFTLQFPQDIDKPNPLTVLASPPLLTAMITKSLDDITALIESHARAQLQPIAASVVQAGASAPAAPALLATPFAADFIASLNFVNAGTEVPLDGAPCHGPECDDALFQHHAATYYGLL